MSDDALSSIEVTPLEIGSRTVPLPELDRRRSARHPAGARAVCYVHFRGEQAVGPLRVRNLSRGGLSLALSRRVPPELVSAVSLYRQADRGWDRLGVRGVYAGGSQVEGFLLGAAFVRELSDEQLRGYLQEA